MKKRALELGTKRNNRDIVSKAREDSKELRARVVKSRTHILNKGRGVKTGIVEGLLGEESLVPVNVGHQTLSEAGILTWSFFTERIIGGVTAAWRELLRSLRMRLSA